MEERISDNCVVNIYDPESTTIDVLLGHDKFILRGYKYNNVQIKGGWYLGNIKQNADIFSSIITKYKMQKITFIGSSKSNTGSFIFTKILSTNFKNIKFKLIAFTPFTTINKTFFIRNNIVKRVPGTLKEIWKSELYNKEKVRLADAIDLCNKNNVLIYVIYPCLSKGGEDLLAQRLIGKNVNHIALPVKMHNTLFPFWNTISDDFIIETHEGVFRKLTTNDYMFYKILQAYVYYKFDIYNLSKYSNCFFINILEFLRRYREKLE